MAFVAPFRSSVARTSSSSTNGSFLAVSISSVRRQILVSSSSTASLRHASTTGAVAGKPAPAASTGPKDFSLQGLDAQVAQTQRQQAQMKRMDVDWLSVPRPVILPRLDPPFPLSRLLSPAGWSQFWNSRRTQLLQARGMLKMIADNGGYNPGRGLLGLPFSRSAKDLIEQAKDSFVNYYHALATGDKPLLRAVATADALTKGQQIASTKRRMKWELIRHITEPKIMNAGVSPIDPYGRFLCAQVYIRFDTEQSLSVGDGPVKTQRVVEYWVVEQMLHGDAAHGWRLKEKIKPMALEEPDRDPSAATQSIR